MAALLLPSVACAYSRDSQGYTQGRPEGVQSEDEARPAPADRGEETGQGMSSSHIWGYVLLTVGGMAAIAGSTMIAATDEDVIGACVSGGGAAMALAGTLLITFGSHGGYAAGPSIDPKSGTYGVVLARRF